MKRKRVTKIDFGVRLTPSTLKAIQEIAQSRELTPSEIIREAVDQYLLVKQN